MKVFLSYCRSDEAVALPLARRLREAGVKLWVDRLDIPAGAAWEVAIDSALQASSHLLLLMSPAAVVSPVVMGEVSYAFEAQMTVVALMLRACELPGRLWYEPYLDFSAGDHAYPALLAALGRPPPPIELRLGPQRLLNASKPVCTLAFSPDGSLLASGSGDSGLGVDGDAAVQLWSLADGRPARQFNLRRDTPSALAFSADGKLLASSSAKSTSIRRVADGELLCRIDPARADAGATTTDAVHSLQFDAEGQRVLVGATVWSVASGRSLGTVSGLSADCTAYALTPDWSTAAIPSADAIVVKRLRSGQTVGHWRTQDLDQLWQLSFSPSGRWLAIVARFKSSGNRVLLWQLGADGGPPVTLATGDFTAAQLAFSRDERWLAVGAGLDVQCYRTGDAGRTTQVRLPQSAGFGRDGISSVAFSPDACWLAVACEDRTLRLWPTEVDGGD